MTSRIWLVMFLFVGSMAYANCQSDDFVNQQYIEHLNHYYIDLNVSIKPGSDPMQVYSELQLLEDYQQNMSTNKATLFAPRLEHVSCNGGPCGGCRASAC